MTTPITKDTLFSLLNGYEDKFRRIFTSISGTLAQPGDVKMSVREADHEGWLIADGRTITRVAPYVALYDTLGPNYVVGVGQKRIPDGQGRTFFGADRGTGRMTTNNTPASTSGLQNVTLTSAQSGMPEHQHHMEVGAFGGGGKNTISSGGKNFVRGDDVSSGGSGNNAIYRGTDGGFAYGLGVGGVVGGAQNAGSSHTNLPPNEIGNWFVKL